MPGEVEGSGWTIDTLKEYLVSIIDEKNEQYRERFQTQVKAIDGAFVAQQTVVLNAISSTEKAMKAALDAAEKAVVKAEVANEKRFDRDQEYRQVLMSQAAALMPRAESDAKFVALMEKLTNVSDVMVERINSLELRTNEKVASNTTRIEKIESYGVGSKETVEAHRQDNTLVVSIIGVILVIITIVMGLYTVLHK